MVEMWQAPLPVFQIVLAVFAINLRYLLIGASLQPVFSGHPLWRKALLMHLVADENWAVTISEHRRNGADPYFLFGGGLLLLFAWTGGAATILIAAAITYAFRLGGLVLDDRLPRTGPVRRFLDALPGAILLSLVVPAAGHAGWAGAVGLAACLAVYLKSKSLLLTMAAGVLAVWVFRQAW